MRVPAIGTGRGSCFLVFLSSRRPQSSSSFLGGASMTCASPAVPVPMGMRACFSSPSPVAHRAHWRRGAWRHWPWEHACLAPGRSAPMGCFCYRLSCFRERFCSRIIARVVKPDVSVIVPIYNVEEYLPNCIQSIIEQSYKNIQIILAILRKN